jgi:hypothetical protein
MDNFFEQIQSMFEDQKLVQDLIDFIAPHEGQEGKIITAYSEQDGEVVFSVFSKEQYEMVKEMATILKKPVEDIIKELGPEEVDQFYYDPDQAPNDFLDDEECIDPDCDCHDWEDNDDDLDED